MARHTIEPFPDRISGDGVILALTPDEVYFETTGTLTRAAMASLLVRHRLALVTSAPGMVPAPINEVSARRRWARITDGVAPEQVVALLHADDDIRLASPVYHRTDLPFKTAFSFADDVLAQYRLGTGQRAIAEVAAAAGAETLSMALELVQADGALLRLKLPTRKGQNALSVAARLIASSEIRDAYPDWMALTPVITSALAPQPCFG